MQGSDAVEQEPAIGLEESGFAAAGSAPKNEGADTAEGLPPGASQDQEIAAEPEIEAGAPGLAVQAPDAGEVDAAGNGSASRQVLETTPDPRAFLEELQALGREVERGFLSIEALFQDKLAYDQFKEAQISKLHAELQEYKADMIARTARPLVAGLVRLHDEAGKTLQMLRKKSEEHMPLEEVCGHIKSFQEDVAILLDENGVGLFVEPGDAFVPSRQTCSRTTPTISPELVGQVAERLRPGFEQHGNVVQRERVSVYAAPKHPRAQSE